MLNDTNYKRKELFILYARFKALCAMSRSPEGIDRDTFRRGADRARSPPFATPVALMSGTDDRCRHLAPDG